jgi:DNA-directed RNA polymerase
VNNPILFDASCSGIQHISAITRDMVLANKVNITSFYDKDIKEKNNSKAEDFYIYAKELIQKELENQELVNLRLIKLNRELIKRTVMTIPYNISLTGVGEQLLEHFTVRWEGKKRFIEIDPKYHINNEHLFLNNKEFGRLTSVIYNTLTKKIKSLKLLSDYLDEILKIILKLKLPVIWNTPSGLKVNLSTMQFEEIRTKSKLLETSKLITISLPKNKLDTQKIRRSFMPNLIHSLDASNIHLLIPKIKGLEESYEMPFYSIHDCFATTANNMNKLDYIVKATFIDIYFGDYNFIENLHNQLISQITDKVAPEDIIIKDSGEIEVVIDQISYILPSLPLPFISKENVDKFRLGIFKSPFFIG